MRPCLGLHLHLFGETQRVVGLNPEVPYCAFDLGLAEQPAQTKVDRPRRSTLAEGHQWLGQELTTLLSSVTFADAAAGEVAIGGRNRTE